MSHMVLTIWISIMRWIRKAIMPTTLVKITDMCDSPLCGGTFCEGEEGEERWVSASELTSISSGRPNFVVGFDVDVRGRVTRCIDFEDPDVYGRCLGCNAFLFDLPREKLMALEVASVGKELRPCGIRIPNPAGYFMPDSTSPAKWIVRVR